MARLPERSTLALRGALAAPAWPSSRALCAGAALAAGAALVSVAAANLEGVPFQARLAVALAVLLGANWLGFRALDTPGRAHVGEAWLAFATFALAAAGAVLAQRYHLGGDGWELWAAWAVGAGAMAWLTRAGLLGIIAALALHGVWLTAPAKIGWLVPWAFGLGLLPLAYQVRSVWLLGLAGAGLVLSLLAVADSEPMCLLLGLAIVPLGLLGWAAWHPRAWPNGDADAQGGRLFAVCMMAVAQVIAAGHLPSGPCMASPSGPEVATLGLADLACIVAWALADGRLADRALHRAMGAAAAVAVVVGTGTVAWLDGMLAAGAIALIGLLTTREGLVLRESGATFVGLAVIGMLLLMVEGLAVATPGGSAFSFLITGTSLVAVTYWLASRNGRNARPGGTETKGVDA